MADELTGGGPCCVCGRDPALGYSSTWSEAEGERWFCHPDDGPSCYGGDVRVVDWPGVTGGRAIATHEIGDSTDG